jgi:hypothetical protein
MRRRPLANLGLSTDALAISLEAPFMGGLIYCEFAVYLRAKATWHS